MCGEAREIPNALPMLFAIKFNDSNELNYDSVNNEEVESGPYLEDT
jgi:hypothetical protein